jgi:hypothetical protein
MKSYKLDRIGVIGVLIILVTWSLVSFSFIEPNSIINFIGQLVGAAFLAQEAFTQGKNRTPLMVVATHVLWVLIVIIALGDYFSW